MSSALPVSTTRTDIVAAVCRAVVGAAPYVGSAAAEAITALIPNQKLDRVVGFVGELDRRVAQLELSEQVLAEHWQSAPFLDLFEDAMLQASRALSDERRRYLASLLASGLAANELNHAQVKKLLRILDAVTDEEVIVLRDMSFSDLDERRAFRARHLALLDPASDELGASQEELDRGSILRSYKQSLVSVGLLEQSALLADDRLANLRATGLGKLLLRYILS